MNELPRARSGGGAGASGPIERLLRGLHPAQRDAVMADEPVVCVLAGAGAGKTRVLTLRVARRALDSSAHPSHVLVCTFSRKAAEELGDRLWALGVGGEVQAGTFHRTALRLITQHRADRGARPPVVLADRRPLLSDLLGRQSSGARAVAPASRYRRVEQAAGRARNPAWRAAPAGAPRDELARLEAEIAWAKARLVPPDRYETAATEAGRRPTVSASRVAEAYGRYEAARRRRGVLDLDDLLWECADLLEDGGSFARAVRWRHRHLLVDEMQDLNVAQFRLLTLLAGEAPDLFVVGDPNQAVYGWNGADPELLGRLPETYPGARVVRLDANHRCSPQIVRVAASVLSPAAHDASGAPPEPGTPASTRDDGAVPRVVCHPTDTEEAAWVARQVWRAHRPGRRWSHIAVLARTNAQLVRLADALAAERVPHRVAGSDLAPASDVTHADRDRDDSADRDEQPDAGDARAGVDHTDTGSPVVDGWTDAVTLATFHRAKGLQWPVVFVIGLAHGVVPHASARSSAARDEERRLLYVALTRAEDELTCTWSTHRSPENAAAGAPGRRPSPWLAGIEAAAADLEREAHEVADPVRVAEHLDRIRHLIDTAPERHR